ncbi:MAG: G5 domain-containing protein [Actinomycetaceae bacterium]|nr:G5 domain-containing protein [Actinomycetaceae bacterium]
MHNLLGRKTKALQAAIFSASATLFLGATLVAPVQAAESKNPYLPPVTGDVFEHKSFKNLVPTEILAPVASFQPADIPVFVYDHETKKDFADADFAVHMHLVAGSPQQGVTGLPEKPIPNKGGVFSFPSVKFTKPGTYKFVYRQIPQVGKHLAYDESLIVQTVEVTPVEGTSHKFATTSTYTQAGKPVSAPRFENQYSTQIENYRWDLNLEGRLQLAFQHQPQPIKAGQFAVEVTASADNPQVANGSIPSAVVKAGKVLVGADGKLDFGTWQFNQPGTYEFTLTQVAGQDKDVKYDLTPVRVLVRVARPAQAPADAVRDSEGYLHIRPAVQFVKGNRFSPNIEFTNQLLAPLPVETFETKVETQEIPFTTVEEENPDAFVGTQEVASPGVNGFKEVTFKQRFLDGKPAGDPQVITETVLRKMEPRVIRKGI